MSFLYPHVLWGLVLPLLIAAAALFRHRRAGAAWRRLVSPAHEKALVTQRAPWHRLCSGICGLLAFTLLLVALARPIKGYSEAGATAASRNLLLALDISRSMETQDVKPSRLEEARAAAYELIDALPEDKIGLIVFSGEADLVVPLTYDHTALRDALEQVDRGWAGSGGTDFNKVLRKAMQDFERSAPDGTNALVLLSDGEDTTDNRKDITEEAKDKHLLVIAVGIGTEAGGAIPDPEGDNGLWQDADGKHVISKLDEESLRRFATATGGDYFRMTGHSDLADFARRAVRKLARHEEEFSVNKVPNDLFAPFAAAALLLLIAAILCGTDWRLPRRGLPLLALLPLLFAGQAQAVVRDSSLRHYREATMLKSLNGEEAKEHFSCALLDSDPALQATALCGIGNTNTQATLAKLKELYKPAESPDDDPDAPAKQQQGPTLEQLRGIVTELKEDITSYAAALKLQPELRPAAVNKARTEELIRVLEEEIKRQEEQQSQQQQENQDNQDQQNDQNQQDNQDKQDQQQDEQNDDKQDGQDRENPQNDKQDNPQDKNDKQDEQQNDKQNQQNDPQQNPQDENDKQNEPQNSQNQQQEQQQQDKDEQSAPEPNPENKKEKAEQRAASILQMHLDEEDGSPIPHAELPARPPKKDY